MAPSQQKLWQDVGFLEPGFCYRTGPGGRGNRPMGRGPCLLVQHRDLDLWNLVLPTSSLGNLGAALIHLGHRQIMMPFVIALPYAENGLLFSFCFPKTQAVAIGRTLSRHLGATDVLHHPRVAALCLHGPHFGDRYGIAHTLVTALHNAGITLLAMACAVSSISVVISNKDLAKAVGALDTTFQQIS